MKLTPARISIHQEHFEEMVKHVSGLTPIEACGIVAGISGESQKVLPVSNILNSSVKYRMDPQGQLDALLLLEKQGWDLLAIYHSHPQGPDHLSDTDIAQAYYPESVYLVFSPDENQWKCRGFSIDESGMHEVKIELIF
jgi:proteasome lid subunit RPN8/RPN11